MNKRIFKITAVILIFFSSLTVFTHIFVDSLPLYTLRRTLTPDRYIPWGNLIARILTEICGPCSFQLEPGIVAETFTALRQLRISPSEPAFRKLARHFLFQISRITPEETQINNLTFLIYEALQKYHFIECSTRNGEMMVTYQKKEPPSFATEVIEPIYLEVEAELLAQQRKNPFSSKVYAELEELYKEMIEKYPHNLRLWWQLSWVYGCLGQTQERRIHFIEGAKQDIIPIPAYTSLYKIALNVTPSVRETASINWGSYTNNNRLFLEEHALKYCLLFPEIFGEGETHLLVGTEEFDEAIRIYGQRAEEILRAKEGIEIYAFVRKNISGGEEPLRYLAYNPTTLEVVGFRIIQDEKMAYKIVIDTFYKASPGMIESLRKERLINLLINTKGEIVVARDDHLDDAYRQIRVEEQRTEFELFELSREMYEPALKIIEERIISQPDKIAVICIGGVSAAGKTPGAEIIENHLINRGRRIKKINMDNYFVNREDTPIITDENGNEIAKDFENPYALNIHKFREDLKRLLAGEEIELPVFDFKSGKSILASGIKIKLEPGDILIIEGIHALNPLFFTDEEGKPIIEEGKTPTVKVAIDASPFIRLPRRIARDMQTRYPTPSGIVHSINQWKYVRMGEDEHIYPTFKNADVVINTDIPEAQLRNSTAYELFREALTLAYQLIKSSPENFPPGLQQKIEEYFRLYFGEIP